MKAIQLAIAIFFSALLMGCQIEVTPLDGMDTDTQVTTDTERDSDTTTPNSGSASNVGTISLSWDIPVERENGEQLFEYEIGGYEIEYRIAGTDDIQSIIIENGSANAVTLDTLEAGNYEFRIAAFDTDGLYSQFTDFVLKSVEG